MSVRAPQGFEFHGDTPCQQADALLGPCWRTYPLTLIFAAVDKVSCLTIKYTVSLFEGFPFA